MAYEYSLQTDVLTVEKTIARNVTFNWNGHKIILEHAGIRKAPEIINRKKCHEVYVVLSHPCAELASELFEEIAIEGYLREDFLHPTKSDSGCSL